MYRVASVPFVNARPLVLALERFGWAEVSYTVPAKLPALLDAGLADVILVSSFDALRTAGRSAAGSCAIASLAAAESVRLFSKVPFGSIKTLALDQSSLTTNHVAMLMLAERYGVKPDVETAPPSLHDMLRDHDACILIGDIGMEADGTGLHVMDLGQEWLDWTGKPFVWALWVGTSALEPSLVDMLDRSIRWGLENMDEVVQDAMNRAGWSREMADHYLREVMSYDFSPAHREGLELFRQGLVRQGFIADQPLPRIVEPALR
jgi:chorismate dehydratase